MATYLTRTAKGRQPVAAPLARLSAERMSGSWQALLGSETLAPCHEFTGENISIAKRLDSQYGPAGGSS
jgi:hypothetical protein